MRKRLLVLSLVGLASALAGLYTPAIAQDDSKDEPIVAASQPATRRTGGLEARVGSLNLAQPLGDVLDALAKDAAMPLRADWAKLAEAGVNKARPLSGHLQGLNVQGCLDIVCRVAGPVAWLQEKGAILVSSRKELSGRTVTQEHLGGGLKASDAAKLLAGLLDLTEDAGVRVADKGEHLAVTAPAIHQEQIDRLLTLVRRGMTADDWSQILGTGRLSSAREAEFDWNGADLRQALADVAARSATTILLDESAVQAGGAKTLPINMKMGRISPEKALTQLVEGGGQGLILETLGRGDIYLVTTKERAHLPLASFTISRAALVKAKVDRVEVLLEMITRTIDPGSWEASPAAAPAAAPADGAAPAAAPAKPGRLMLVGSKLICRQSAKNLSAIGDLLDDPMYKAVAKRLAAMSAAAAKASAASGAGKTTPSGPLVGPGPIRTTPPTAGKTEPASRPTVRLPVGGSASDESPQARQFKLAEIYLKQGLTDKAKEMLQKIVDKYPDSDEAAKAKKRLEDSKEE